MRLTLIPRSKFEFLVTNLPHPAGFVPASMPDDLTYISIPPFDEPVDWTNPETEIYNKLPQKVDVKMECLELYSQQVFPMYYTFDYPYDAAKAGRFYVPPATIDCAFSTAGKANTECDTVIIEE